MLSPRWHKVLRDLWSNKTRTVLIVLSISVGVFAFGSVFITQEVLLTDMTSQYRAIRPSTITLNMRSFDDPVVNWVRRQKEVTAAQGRATYSVKVLHDGRQTNLDLSVYDDFDGIVLNKITPQAGNWPPGRGEICLERDSLTLSGAAIGDNLTMETASGDRYSLRMIGTVHDLNAVPATMYPQMSGYITEQTAKDIGLPYGYTRLDITVQPEYDTKAKLESVANALKERLQRAGAPVTSFSVRESGEHWARQTTESFSLILAIIGFFSLVLSGFLVVNTVSALLSEQRRQIGIMKAVGGTGRQVMGLYFTLVTVYGVLGLVLALPISLLLGYAFISAVTNFLNIDIVNFHMPLQVFLMQVGAAVAVPVLSSIVPILGGVRVTTREAISNQGARTKLDHGWFARLILAVRFLPRPLLLSLRNTFRRKARLLLTLVSLALAGMLFITVINVRSALLQELEDGLNSTFNFELVVTLDRPYERAGIERKVLAEPGVKQVEGRVSLPAQYVKKDGSLGSTFSISGLPPDSDFVDMRVQEGRWLTVRDRNAIVISNAVAEEMPGVRVGDEIKLSSLDEERKWKVVGIVYVTTQRGAYANFDYVSQLMGRPGMAAWVFVRMAPDSELSQAEMARRLEERLKDSGVGVSGTMTKDTIVASDVGQFDFLIGFLLSMAAMTGLVGALGLAGMMGLNVMERTREIGIMRSIGASHAAIGGMVAGEGLLIGFMSWVLAVPFSVPFTLLFNAMLGQIFIEKPLVFVYTPLAAVAWLGIVLLMAFTSSLLPAFRATRMSVRETLAYE